MSHYSVLITSKFQWLLFAVVFFIPTIVFSQGQPGPDSTVPAKYRKFFMKYKDGRSMPANVLAAHGIDEHKIGRSYALLAGISHYSNLPSEQQELSPARVDVEGLLAYLKDHEYFDEIVVLEDQDVTLDNLNYFLQVYFPDRMGEAEQNSRFLFAYSGHGFDFSGDGYLLTSLAASMDDRRDSIDLAQLKVAVEKSVAKALNALVLINSCQGGVFLERLAFGEKQLVIPKIGAHAITAGAKGQFTYGAGGQGRGSYFFEEVLNALKGGADTKNQGLVATDQLFSFVRHEVQRDTNGDQDPQVGDIEPHTSQGSFFFVLPTSENQPSITALSQDVDCLGALQLDYYDYAVANNFQDDFLRSLDQQSWQRLRAVGVGTTALFGAGKSFLGASFSLADDYTTFDQKRSEHLKNVFYSRSRDQALSVLQQTVATREYPAYTRCMQALGTGSPMFSIWATRETLDEVDLDVRYSGADDTQMAPIGTIEGGSVTGSKAGSLWNKAPSWTTSKREHHFVVNRDPHVPETTVTLTTEATSMPFVKSFKRADAILTTTYMGTAELPQPAKRRVDVRTPNNNENRGNCPNEVGHHDGKYCTSRTALTLTTTSPHLFKNAKVDCGGGGCPWGATGPVTISPDGLTASGYVDNWGSSVTATLTADEYETISAGQCGAESSVPVIQGKQVLIGIRKECLPIALIKWTSLPDMSEGLFHFGDKESSGGEVVLNGSVLPNDTALFASYSLKRPETGKATSTKASSVPNTVWQDPSTGLMWAGSDNGYNINWKDANNFCSPQLKIGEYSGWRLPDINELKTLYDGSFNHYYTYHGEPYNGFYDGDQYLNHAKASVEVNSCCVWSSTPYNDTEALYLRFQSDEVIHYPREKRGAVRALCVRKP